MLCSTGKEYVTQKAILCDNKSYVTQKRDYCQFEFWILIVVHRKEVRAEKNQLVFFKKVLCRRKKILSLHIN